jgi:protein gp37
VGASTAIAWTDHTFNPWWGCVNVSPGCDHCYAEAFAKRVGQDVWGKDGARRFFGDKHWAEPLKWEGRVFCASMADVFEMNHTLDVERERLWRLIDATPHLTWQLLTKRPENVERIAPTTWLNDWPENVWLGTTVEDQTRANLRVPRLLAVEGVKVRFLSCEPLIGPVTFRWAKWVPWRGGNHLDGLKGISWVIVGGESGAGHRPLSLDWARTIRDECAEANVPLFFKQVGGRTPTSGGDELDGIVQKEFPLPLPPTRHRPGG